MKKEWYVVNTVSGYEYKVKEKLEMMIKNSSEIQEKIFRVIVPEQTIVEYKDGVKKEKIKKMFPGYVLVEMIMDDEVWFIVRNTQGVTGFIGSSGKKVKIVSGPFKDMIGKISSYDLEKKKVNLLLDLFGQETPVEAELNQIENI